MSSSKSDTRQYWDHAPCRCPDWLINAWVELVFRSKIPDGESYLSVEEIAETMGLTADMLRKLATKPTNAGSGHRCSRAALIIPATRASGNLVLINAFAQHAGVTTPRPRKPSGESADRLVRQAVHQFGEALRDVGDALKEHPLRTEDKVKIRDRFRSLRSVFDDFEATVGQENIRRIERGSTA